MSVIYFIGNGRSVKVGFSRQVGARFRELQTTADRKLEFLGCVDGTIKHERAIHSLLDQYRLEGEWFADCPDVREVISGILRDGVGHLSVSPGKKMRPEAVLTESFSLENIFLGLGNDQNTDRLERAMMDLARARAERIRLEKVLADFKGGRLSVENARLQATVNV